MGLQEWLGNKDAARLRLSKTKHSDKRHYELPVK